MRTFLIILGGFLLLGLGMLTACLLGSDGKRAAVGASKIFLLLWLVIAGVNLWFGVSRAGYSVREEFPIFLVIFSLPAIAAIFVWWKFGAAN